jgi:hypothetical protein
MEVEGFKNGYFKEKLEYIMLLHWVAVLQTIYFPTQWNKFKKVYTLLHKVVIKETVQSKWTSTLTGIFSKKATEIVTQ